MGSKKFVVLATACLVGVTFLGISQAQQTPSLEYGASCSAIPGPTDPICDPAKYLKCHSFNATVPGPGTCGCMDTFIRDHDANGGAGGCVVPVGDPAATCVEHIKNGTFPTPCTSNAFCVQRVQDTPGYCQCLPAFTPTPIGQCKLSHGSSPCEKHTDCNINSFLTCGANKTCECDQERAVWSGNTCVGLVGGRCTNATTPNPDNPLCDANMDCTNNLCACQGNFDETADHQCRLSHGQPCQATSECNSIFECNDSTGTMTCQCPASTNFENGQCKHLAGKQCSAENDECTGFSSCLENASTNTTTCQCDSGYSAMKSGLCRADHGGQCDFANVNADCNTDRYLVCDETGLTCTCAASYTYLNGRCEGDVGQACNVADDNCIGNSQCSGTENTTCTCPSPSSPSGNNKDCFLDYQHQCSNGAIECNPDKFLTCDNASCNCLNSTEYIYQSGTCRGLANAACPGGRGCVTNANCVDQICVCNANFFMNGERGCDPGSAGGGAGTLQASLTFVSLMGIFISFSKLY